VPQQAAAIVKLFTISSKTGIPLNAIFYPSDNWPHKDNYQSGADKNIFPIFATDFLISNVKKGQDANQSDSLKGHYKDPQIPFVNLFVSNPNDNHRSVMLRAMHDSGCAKSVI